MSEKSYQAIRSLVLLALSDEEYKAFCDGVVMSRSHRFFARPISRAYCKDLAYTLYKLGLFDE